MKTWSAYAFWWLVLSIGVYSAIINEFFVDWSSDQSLTWSIIFGVGLIVLMYLGQQNKLK